MRIPTHPRQRNFLNILPYVLPIIFILMLLDRCFGIIPDIEQRSPQKKQQGK